MEKDKELAKKRVEKLTILLDKHRDLYYVQDAPIISDEAYDSLFEELVFYEKKFPSLLRENSPTTRVGGVALDTFVKVQHQVKQWSFDDVFDYDELVKWHEKTLRAAVKSGFDESLVIEYCAE